MYFLKGRKLFVPKFLSGQGDPEGGPESGQYLINNCSRYKPIKVWLINCLPR